MTHVDKGKQVRPAPAIDEFNGRVADLITQIFLFQLSLDFPPLHGSHARKFWMQGRVSQHGNATRIILGQLQPHFNRRASISSARIHPDNLPMEREEREEEKACTYLEKLEQNF